jgi:YHS domain-containing protein
MQTVMRPLWWLPVLAWLALGSAPAWAHDVKDPVCRMTVDSDTAKWKHKLGNKSFYFCSQQCVERFKAAPAKYEKLAAQLEKQDLHEYTVDLETSPSPVAGQPVELAFAVRYKQDGKLVRDFEVIHERLFHLIMVTEDLSWFEHQHPVRGEDGIFRFSWKFPRPGRYTLYADFTPADGDNQVKPLPLAIGGGPGRPHPLTPDRARTKQIGDLTVHLRVHPEPLRMEKQALLTYTLRDRRGRPVRDMQPFIGAPGHLLAISQDGKEMVHTHSIAGSTAPPMEKGAIHVTPAMATEKGPAFSFKLTLPNGGLYKTWAQFMRGNKVVTVPFTFDVQELWTSPAAAVPKPARAGGVQKQKVVIDGGYTPASIPVKAGRPVQLTFVRQAGDGCGEELLFPTLGVKRTLKPGQQTVVSFTPRKSGVVNFTCGMKMYRGQLKVQ